MRGAGAFAARPESPIYFAQFCTMSLVDVQMMSTQGRGVMKELLEREVDGKTYTVVPPGVGEYAVRVQFKKGPDGAWPYDKVKIGCYVDGHDVNYWKRMDFGAMKKDQASAAAFFLGFRRAGSEIRAFTFASTVPDSNDSTSAKLSNSLASVGSVKVEIFAAKAQSKEIYANKAGGHDIPSGSKAVSGNKKFWQQASLNTSGGRAVSEAFNPIEVWQQDGGDPVLVVEKWYHSAAMLDTIEQITGKKRPRTPEPEDILDLTADDNGAEVGKGDDDGDDDDDDEVQAIPAPPKIVPMVDVSGDMAEEMPDVVVSSTGHPSS